MMAFAPCIVDVAMVLRCSRRCMSAIPLRARSAFRQLEIGFFELICLSPLFLVLFARFFVLGICTSYEQSIVMGFVF